MTAAQASRTARPDTREMVIVHNVFRRLFGDLPGLLRGVADGDTARADRLARCFEVLAATLHHHHTAEDEVLWPILLQRLGSGQALVLRAEEQHERVHELLERAHNQLPSFRAYARAAQRDRVAGTIAELDAVLREHLDEEEHDVLPLVEQHVTVAEWRALAERARAGVPKNRLLVQLGWMLDGLSDAQRRKLLATLPRPARLAWRLVGRRSWARERDAVYGA